MTPYLKYLLCLLCLYGCEGTTYRSSVPNRPVQLSVNTEAGIYVHFVPDNINSFMIVNEKGYQFNGQSLPVTDVDYYGYAGVVIYIDNNRQYSAFDLCCPHCVKQSKPCEVDGIYAICPICGEHYDLSFGFATPVKGISTEALRKYTTFYTNHRLTVHD